MRQVDLDHAQLSVFPNRTDPFFGTLLKELHELLDVNDDEGSAPDKELEAMISSLNASLVSLPLDVESFSKLSIAGELNSVHFLTGYSKQA